jgi:hypothetical protein
MNIKDVFQPLYAEVIKKEFKEPWSIVELQLGDRDLEWLRKWFSNLDLSITENWIRSGVQQRDVEFSNRQMFGLLLLCIAAEVCREESREDSVWPTIKKLFSFKTSSHNDMFLSNGEPSTLLRGAITDAVYTFNMRHAIGIEGTQQWFTTIKLQYGFTYKGAKNRLAEWLVNIGRPHAVQYLNGDLSYEGLQSNSFMSLWKALIQYRRDLINKDEILNTFKDNPWIKKEWIDTLLEEACSHIDTLGYGEGSTKDYDLSEIEEVAEETDPIKKIELEWNYQKTPRLKIHLDREIIEEKATSTNYSELDFYIDGKKACPRWVRQRDDSWSGHEVLFDEKKQDDPPNLSPHYLSIKSRSGDTLIGWDLVDSEFNESVLFFDMDKKELIKTAYLKKLNPDTSYAIICDRRFDIKGCKPTEVFERNGLHKKVIRINPPISENLQITYDDFILWQPVKNMDDLPQKYKATLITDDEMTYNLGDRAILYVKGLPYEIYSASLLIHKKTYELERVEEMWCTKKPITLTPERAAGQRLVKIKFEGENLSRTITPRIQFSLLGAAMMKYNSEQDKIEYKILDGDSKINRSEETKYIRIWTPNNENKTFVMEENNLVGRLKYKKIPLKDFMGVGGQIKIISGNKTYNFEAICIDKGCVRTFIPSLIKDRANAKLEFTTDKDPDEIGENGYLLYTWIFNHSFQSSFLKINIDNILPQSNKRVWKLSYNEENRLALALTYKGACCGAWWELDKLKEYINRVDILREIDYAWLLWFRVPVLDPVVASAVKRTVLKDPCTFIKVWKYKDFNLPSYIDRYEHLSDFKPDAVVRHFLWLDFPSGQIDNTLHYICKYRLQKDAGNQYERCFIILDDLKDISPILFWKGLKYLCQRMKFTIEKMIQLIEWYLREKLGLPYKASERQVCYRIQSQEYKLTNSLGVDSERIKESVGDLIVEYGQKNRIISDNDKCVLQQLSETPVGRSYLVARICYQSTKIFKK